MKLPDQQCDLGTVTLGRARCFLTFLHHHHHHHHHQHQEHHREHDPHQLVFRAKLTQHTAFERADNTEPAAVTALAVSKYDFLHPSLFG